MSKHPYTPFCRLVAFLVFLYSAVSVAHAQGSISLIGKDLTGWKTRDERNGWKVENGVLINTPPSSDLISTEKFWNFELHYEYNVAARSNSGMYLRGRYEIQILDDFGKPTAPGGNGSIYGQVVAKSNASKHAGEWQTVDVKMVDKRVTVTLNGTTIIENAEMTGPTGGALDDKVDEAGPIMLQGDHGAVSFRNMTIKRLPADSEATPLFPTDGAPKGWVVREWSDLAKEAGRGTQWTVKDGVLRPGEQRGTWLVSEKEYGDFILEFEIKLSEHGNSGVALRSPMKGDPAFDGMELQIADYRYNTSAKDSELTGGIYRAIAPTKQVYKPTEWNRCRIELRGSRLKATINGELIQDVDLTKFDEPVKRHDGTDAPPVKDRPRKGHIGFQHLSRNNEPIEIRGAKIKELK
jgi:hypothetical protein